MPDYCRRPAVKPIAGPAIAPLAPAPVPVAESTWRPRDILCACNLDPSSAPIAAYAHRLAREYGSTFTIFHVDDSEGRVSKEMQLLRFEKALTPLLIGEEKPEILCRTLLIGYGLGSTVADLAIERDSDLIVMGANAAPHANTHFPRAIAPQVVAKAPCPVMILHQHGETAS